MTAPMTVHQSLIDRARVAAEEHARIVAENTRVANERARKDASEMLAQQMERWLDVTVSPEEMECNDKTGLVSVVVDGQRFAIVEHGSYDYSHSELSVATTCAKGCGLALWESVEAPIRRLHEILNDETLAHYTNCTQSPFSVLPTRPEPQDRAQSAVERITEAGERVAQAYATVQDLADGRAIEKSFAIRRLMQLTNEETGKQHSASSAEKVVELNAEFRGYRARERDAEVERHRADASYAAALRMADLEIAAYRAATRTES